MKFSELEQEYMEAATAFETRAHETDERAKVEAARIRTDEGFNDNETLTDSNLVLAMVESIPKVWRDKALKGSLPKDSVTGVLDGRKRPKGWQARCTAIVRAAMDPVYAREDKEFAGAPRRIAAACYGLAESIETLPMILQIAESDRSIDEKGERLAEFLSKDIDVGGGLTLDSRASRNSFAKRGRKPEASLDDALAKFFRTLTEDEGREASFTDALEASQARTVAKVYAMEAAKAANKRTQEAEKAAKKVA